jgi:hypothetical protein
MIHLAIGLIALVVVLGFIGMTFTAIGAAFQENAFLGIVVLLVAGMFWLAVIAFVF